MSALNFPSLILRSWRCDLSVDPDRRVLPAVLWQESASDFWRRRLFFMARDRLAHILPPMAVVLAASVFVTLLYMGTLKPDMHLPIQIPMTVLAWARLVLAVQIIKVRSSVSC
jgi:hypothetical protein